MFRRAGGSLHVRLCPGRSLRLRLRRVPPRPCCRPPRYLGLGRPDCLLGSPRSHVQGWAGHARGNGALDPLLPVLLQALSPRGQCRTHVSVPNFQPGVWGWGMLVPLLWVCRVGRETRGEMARWILSSLSSSTPSPFYLTLHLREGERPGNVERMAVPNFQPWCVGMWHVCASALGLHI